MQKLMRLVTATSIAALIGAASPVWAESAPVFDVDSFESMGSDQAQELPMPPAPGEEAASTHAVSPPSEAPATTFTPVEPSSAAGSSSSPAAVGAVASPEESAPQPAAGVSVSTENLSPEERMRRLEQQLSNLQNSEGVQQVESLQTEVQSLRGQIEVLNHELDKVRSQQKTASNVAGKDVSSDPDSDTTGRPIASAGAVTAEAATSSQSGSKKSESKKSVVAGTDKPSAKTATSANHGSGNNDQPDVAQEQKIYQTAYDFIKAKKYNDAVNALQDMLKKYPSGQFASNAHYWLGELYGLMGKNDNAFDEFSLVINKFPGSPRVSDAQLKVGLILAAQSKWSDAKRAFKQVINTYPGTASARLASEQLKQIKTAGH